MVRTRDSQLIRCWFNSKSFDSHVTTQRKPVDAQLSPITIKYNFNLLLVKGRQRTWLGREPRAYQSLWKYIYPAWSKPNRRCIVYRPVDCNKFVVKCQNVWMCEHDMSDVVGPLQWWTQGCSTLHLSKHTQGTSCIQQILLLTWPTHMQHLHEISIHTKK